MALYVVGYRYTLHYSRYLHTLSFIIVSVDLEVQVRNGVLLSNGMRVGKIFLSQSKSRVIHMAGPAASTFSYLKHPVTLSSSGGLQTFTPLNVLYRRSAMLVVSHGFGDIPISLLSRV